MAATPLPPPVPVIKIANEQIRIAENPESSKVKGVQEQCLKVAESHPTLSKSRHWILCNVNVQAKLQGNAPRCGLVSLSMAAEMAQSSKQTSHPSILLPNPFHYDINDFESEMATLSNLAKRKNFSSKGEMFSANNLGELAKEFYGLDVRITDSGLEDINGIVNHLCEGNPILVPYDASPNHAPCLANGSKAHWALLTGFFYGFDGNEFDWKNLQQMATEARQEINGSETSIFTLNKLPTNRLSDISIDSSTLYLLARQPKSRHVGVWSWNALHESNANLLEYCPDKGSANSFVLPKAGLLEGLCRKIIYVEMKK